MFFLPKDLSESGRMTFRAELEAGIVGSVFVGANALLVVLLKKYFGASLLQLGIFGSISSIAYISAIWLNRLTEQIRARTLIRYAGMVRSLLFILLGFVQTPVGLIVVFGLSQIAYAAIHPAMSRLWKANYNDRERMEVTGSLNAIRSLFEMALAWFITMLFDYNELTFRIIVPLSGICGAVSFLIISRVKLINGDTEDVPPRHKSDRNILVEYYHVLIKNKPLAYFLFLFFFFGSANWIHNVLQVAYLEELLGLSYQEFSFILFIIPQFVTIMTFPVVARMINRHGIFKPFFLFCIIDVFYYLMMSVGTNLAVFALAKCLKGFAQGGTSLLWAIGVLHFGTSKAEIRQFAAIHLSLTGVRALIGPFLGLLIAHYLGLASIFVFAGLFSSVALISLGYRFFMKQNVPDNNVTVHS